MPLAPGLAPARTTAGLLDFLGPCAFRVRHVALSWRKRISTGHRLGQKCTIERSEVKRGSGMLGGRQRLWASSKMIWSTTSSIGALLSRITCAVSVQGRGVPLRSDS